MSEELGSPGVSTYSVRAGFENMLTKLVEADPVNPKKRIILQNADSKPVASGNAHRLAYGACATLHSSLARQVAVARQSSTRATHNLA
ncbi:hypothetical protein AAHC03_010264 [Spirometra sp. Aus1]